MYEKLSGFKKPDLGYGPQEFPRPLGERIPMSTVLSSNLWQKRKLETVIRTGQGAYVLSRQLRQVLQLRHDVVSPPIENGDSKNCEEHESDQGFADYYTSGLETNSIQVCFLFVKNH